MLKSQIINNKARRSRKDFTGEIVYSIMEHDFVDEEQLEDIVKENATDLSRLRCFLGNTYEANIYRIDGYGNLANVENEDFENLIDDLVYELESNITVPLAQEIVYERII